MKTALHVVTAIGLLAVSLSTARAAVVVEYDVANANAASSNVVNVANTAANTAVTVMTSFGPLGTPFNSPQSFCYQDWPTGGARDPGRYFEFSVTPVPGFSVQYQSIDLAVASGGAGTGTFEVHASLDGFNTSDVTLFAQAFTINATWQVFNGLDIAALGMQPGTVTFRFTMYGIPAAGLAGLGVNPAFGTGKNFFVNGIVSQDVVPVEATTWSRVKSIVSAP